MFTKTIFFILAISLVSSTPSCSYKLAGTSNSLPSHLKTISIPMFMNNSKEPGIEKKITQLIKKTFISDGRLTLTNTNKADMSLKGSLDDYYVKPIAFNTLDNVTEYRLFIKINFDLIDLLNNRTIIKQTIHTNWEYEVNSSIISTESAREQAVVDASKDLSQRLINIILEDF